MFRRLWRSATGADEQQQQQQSGKNGAHVNGHTTAATAAQTHADNQSAAATLHTNHSQPVSSSIQSPNPSTASAASSSALFNSSTAATANGSAGTAAISHSHSATSSSTSSSSVGSPPTPLVISESVLRPAPSTSFPVGEKFYGLENANNVCYANSVLQALYACRPFRQQLLVYYEDSNNKKRKPDETLLLSLATLFYRIQTSKKARGVVSPAAFVKKLKKSNEQFDSTAHQDAQEFLIFLLNDISDTIKAEREKAARDKQAALLQQHAGSGTGLTAGNGVPHVAPRKSGFASLFSSSSSAPSPPAPTHHSLFSTNASSSSSAAASSSSSAASHTSSHPTTSHAVDGVGQLQNMSAVSAATAAGSKATSNSSDTHEQQHSTTQPSSTASTNSSSSSTASTTSSSTTDSSLPNHSSVATSAPSTSTQPSASSSSHSSTAATSSTVASTSTSALSSASVSLSASWVQGLFEGTLTNLTSCLRCGSVSERDESFLDLSVDLLEHHSLSSCLRSFSHDELLSGNDKYLCDACGCRQEAVKSLRIKSTPAILILHMKRFKYQETIRTFAKLTYRVTFPLSLRLPNTTGDCGLYSLTAVVVHIGNGARSGHYVCMCRGSSGQFYLYDDTSITAIGEAEVQATFGSEMGGSHQDGYLLFYSQEQSSTRPTAMHTRPQQMSGRQSTGVDGDKAAADGLTAKPGVELRVERPSGISVVG